MRRSREPRCNHYGYGAATTYPINRWGPVNTAMKYAFGGDGRYRESVLVVYCDKCQELLEVNSREATPKEKKLWKSTGGKSREYWESLPFLP